MITVFKRQDNGTALYKVQGLLFEEGGRCNNRVLLARQLDLIEKQLGLGGRNSGEAGALEAVVAFRSELSRSFVRKDVLQRLIKAMEVVPDVKPLVTELRQTVTNLH